ncbi:hypothetical protein ACIBG4_04970 [Nonomuraea sp. NPDC050383]|uniref:hypothetical protein n=1 Tax=Nonomuraea sp. NPDC050383 TaxID=3364362 RepID=UPI00379454C6
MRDVYRGLAVLAAAATVAAGVVFVLPQGPDEVAAGPITAPSARPSSSGPLSSGPLPSGPLSSGVPSAEVSPVSAPTEPAPASSVTSAPAPTPLTPTPLAATGRPVPTPGTSLAPGYTAMEALHADARLPALPARTGRVRLKAAAGRPVEDRRTGLALPRLGKPWKLSGPAPFTTRQVLPKVRGAGTRGMFVTCPLPIETQKAPRDSALLAARWTLNHHPEGATISWLASQPVRNGWMLMYRVKYGRHSSRAAVVVLDGGMRKPGLAFVTVPDTQRKRWGDVTRVISGVRVLG